MQSRRPFQSLVFALAILLAAPSPGCAGEAAPGEPTAMEALRADLPAHARHVLDGPRALVRADEGFTDRPGDLPHPGGLRARLPGDPSAGVRFEADGAFAITVREAGLSGRGEPANAAVAYPRAGGTSYWAATEEGYEEWLYLRAGVATGRAPVAVWAIEGASLREEGGGVSIADETGFARLRVTAPSAWAVSGEPVGARLAVRGNAIELWVDAGGAAVLVDPVWTATTAMLDARESHDLLLLKSGKVLAIGGTIDQALGLPTATTELYDPAAPAWSSGGAMSTPRAGGTMTVLGDGRVLATGGAPDDSLTAVSTTELYDPVSNTWSPGPSMTLPRLGHSATLLPSGKVLIVGGRWQLDPSTAFVSSSTALYDPATNTWSAAAPMALGRWAHEALLLQNGKVLVFGGSDETTPYQSALLYDPASNTWSSGGSDPGLVRENATATLLADGKVLVTGGSTMMGYLATTLIYDPATSTWSAGTPMLEARRFHTATLLPAGQVVVTGGANSGPALGTSEIYDPATSTWTAGPLLSVARYWHAATVLPSGRLMVAGGSTGGLGSSKSAELLTLDASGAGCAVGATCATGVCHGGICCIAACAPPDACHLMGSCEPGTGACINPPALDGAGCDDGNPCTMNDACQSGVCVGGSTLSCSAMNACHEVGVCDPALGACTNPAKPDDTPCNNGVCVGGLCISDNPSSGAGTGVTSGSTGATSSSGGGGGPGASGGCSQSAPSPRSIGALWLCFGVLLVTRRGRRRHALSFSRNDLGRRSTG